VNDQFRWYVPFEKVEQQDDGSVIVEGPVSSESIDSEDEIVDYDALKAAAADYMQFANIREMHDPHTASGTMLDLQFDDSARKIWGRAHIVDAGAVKKVLTGVFKGFSIGGRKLAWEMQKVGDRAVRRLTKMWWAETSLVDRPANPDAIFTIAKREQDKETKVAKAAKADTTPAPDADPAAPDADSSAGAPPFPGAKAPFKKKVKKAASKAGVGVVLAKMELLSKGGNKTVKHLLAAMEEVVCAISNEAAESDEEAVTALQGILSNIQKQISVEAGEPDAGDDDEEDDDEGEMEPEPLMPDDMGEDDMVEMAARIKSLRKAAARREDRKMAKLRKQAKANRDTMRKVAKLAKRKSPSGSSSSSAGSLEKTASTIDALMAKVSSTERPASAELDIVKAEVLAALSEAKEDLRKTIEAQPTNGGPLANPDLSRFGQSADDASTASEAAALQKVMGRITDPIAREALGKAAASLQIEVLQQGR